MALKTMLNNSQIISFFEQRKDLVSELKETDKSDLIIRDTSKRIGNIYSFLTVGENELQQHLLDVHFKSRLFYTAYVDQSNYILKYSLSNIHSLVIDILDIEAYYINFDLENLYTYFLDIKNDVNSIVKESNDKVGLFVFLEYNIGLMYMEFLLGMRIQNRLNGNEFKDINIMFQTFFELYKNMLSPSYNGLLKTEIVNLQNEVVPIKNKSN